MNTDFCLDILAKALKQSHPEIINSDQGSQFTSSEWINSLNKNNIQISMDSVGRWADKSEAIATRSIKNKSLRVKTGVLPAASPKILISFLVANSFRLHKSVSDCNSFD